MNSLAPHSRYARHWRRSASGVSLVEALVSLAVMSFGMLGVVGVQATLRYNTEISKQRSEAVRIAQEEMESLRSFVQQGIDPSGIRRAYADLQAGTTSRVFGGALTTNTNFNIERSVSDTNQGFRGIRVRVLWTDRNGNTETVALASQIAALGPDSTADLLRRETVSQPDSPVAGRHVAIPVDAQVLQTDPSKSVFKPLQDGTLAGTIAWVFDNTTGMIVGECTVQAGSSSNDLRYSNLAWCSSNADMHLLSGTVRFSTDVSQPGPAQAENPTSPALNLDIRLDLAQGRSYRCFDDAPSTAAAAAGQVAVRYHCAIRANASKTWQGTAMVVPRDFSDTPNSDWVLQDNGLSGSAVVDHLLCRYTPAASDSVWVGNELHPRVYGYRDAARQLVQTTPMGNLLEQNFLVIRSPNTCPTDGPANPAVRDFVNSNTLEHLPLAP